MKTFTTPKGTRLPLLDLRGKDYLQIAHRLIWFREEHPDWSIETDLVASTPTSTLFKATIRNCGGIIISTGHKYEDAKGFADHTEKAETGAIGRALALIGYGTQFCADELEEGKRLADSPISRPSILEQPGIGNGNTSPLKWTCSFGKYVGRSMEQICSENSFESIDGYIRYLKDSAAKKGMPVGEKALEFEKMYEAYRGALENAPLESDPNPLPEPSFLTDKDIPF